VPRATPLPPPLGQQPFTVAEAAELGIPRSRLRSKDLVAPFHGVRSPSSDDVDPVRAYAARMAPTERFTHTTAAQLNGLRMPRGYRGSPLHVGVPRPRRAPRSVGIVGHQLPAGSPLVLVRGLPVSPPLAAWAQCASILDVDDLIVMGDGLVARKRPLATLEQLAVEVAGHAGERGVRKLERAFLEIRSGTDSAMETVLRLVLVRAGFPEPEVNGEIRNEYGVVIAHGDLVYREQRVVIEYDGAGHWERKQYISDIARLDEIMELGWRVIRVDSSLLARRATLFGKVRRALAR
jgi:hypothetical protein